MKFYREIYKCLHCQFSELQDQRITLLTYSTGGGEGNLATGLTAQVAGVVAVTSWLAGSWNSWPGIVVGSGGGSRSRSYSGAFLLQPTPLVFRARPPIRRK